MTYGSDGLTVFVLDHLVVDGLRHRDAAAHEVRVVVKIFPEDEPGRRLAVGREEREDVVLQHSRIL